MFGTVAIFAVALAVQAPDADPIGDLVNQALSRTASQPPPAAPPAYTPPPQPPQEVAPPLPAAPRPYTTMKHGPSVMPWRSMFAAKRVLLPPKPKGPMDGAWQLTTSGGYKLYDFQFNDLGGHHEIEGAWQDLRMSNTAADSGPLQSVDYDETSLSIRFVEKGRVQTSVISLRPAGDGSWVGQLQGDGAPTQVVMRRD